MAQGLTAGQHIRASLEATSDCPGLCLNPTFQALKEVALHEPGAQCLQRKQF